MEKIYTVYRFIFPNGKVYIGKTMQKLEDRWKNGEGYKRQKKIYSAIEEFGWDNIKKEIIASELSEKEAEILEAKYINESFNKGNSYNENHGVERPQLNFKESLKRTTEEEKNKNEKIRQAIIYTDKIRKIILDLHYNIIGTHNSRRTKWVTGSEGGGITFEEENEITEKLKELKQACSIMVSLDIE